jgi:hypothetical protein
MSVTQQMGVFQKPAKFASRLAVNAAQKAAALRKDVHAHHACPSGRIELGPREKGYYRHSKQDGTPGPAFDCRIPEAQRAPGIHS